MLQTILNKNPIFKNNAPFSSCISKNHHWFIENAEDLVISWYVNTQRVRI